MKAANRVGSGRSTERPRVQLRLVSSHPSAFPKHHGAGTWLAMALAAGLCLFAIAFTMYVL